MGFDLEDKNVAFVEAKLSIEEMHCAFCKELSTDQRVTGCCKKYVCFECWKRKVKGIDYDDEYYDIWDFIYVCRLCRFYFDDSIYLRGSYCINLFVPRAPTICKKKIDAVMVKCPDKDCKVFFII